MRHLSLVITTLLLAISTLWAQEQQVAEESFSINHGPYLQNLDEQGVSIYFSTSHNAFSQVEVRKVGCNESTLHYTTINGLKVASTLRVSILKARRILNYA